MLNQISSLNQTTQSSADKFHLLWGYLCGCSLHCSKFSTFLGLHLFRMPCASKSSVKRRWMKDFSFFFLPSSFRMRMFSTCLMIYLSDCAQDCYTYGDKNFHPFIKSPSMETELDSLHYNIFASCSVCTVFIDLKSLFKGVKFCSLPYSITLDKFLL